MALKIIGLFTAISLQLYLVSSAPTDQLAVHDSKSSGLPDELWPFLTTAVDRLKEIPNSEDRLLSALDVIEQTFRDRDDILEALLTMAKKFLAGGYHLSPETATDIITKAVRHSQKEPDTLLNNATKLSYKAMKTVGNAIENGGDLIATGVKTVKDLQNTQAPVTNAVAEFVPVPYFGKVVRAFNSALSNTLELLQLSAKFASRAGGRTVNQAAENQKLALRERKQKILEKRQAKEKQAEELMAANSEVEQSKEEGDQGKKKKGGKKAKKKKDEDIDYGDA